MKRDNAIALVDTNVLLDNYLPDRPHAHMSREFLDYARAHEVQLVYPVHALSDFFLLLQQHLKRRVREKGVLSDQDALAIQEIAWACVDSLRESATAVGADESDAWRACKYRSLTNDLEDNMVLAAAERAQVDFLVTNDKDLIRKSTVNAYTPEDALKALQVM